MFVDSHCHINFEGLGDRLPQVIDNMRSHSVTHALCVSVDLESLPSVLAVADAYENVFASVGVHPDHEDAREPSVAELVELAKHPKVVAIGETGLDYYRDWADPAGQREWFRAHIELARRTGKALMIHDRDAHEDVLSILAEYAPWPPDSVIFHCFSGNAEMAAVCAAAGYLMSFAGNVTFKNADPLRAGAQTMDMRVQLGALEVPGQQGRLRC